MRRALRTVLTGAAIAARPKGLRRLLGLLVTIALIAALALIGIATFAGRSEHRTNTQLACAPEAISVRYSPSDPPSWVQEAVEKALHDAGRSPRTVDNRDHNHDLQVLYWPSSSNKSPGLAGKTLRLENRATSDDVAKALKPMLGACSENSTSSSEPGRSDSSETLIERWSWNNPLTLVCVVVAAWWTFGPWLVKFTIRVARRTQKLSSPDTATAKPNQCQTLTGAPELDTPTKGSDRE